jgi:DNA-damage-inducible protein D
MEPKDKIIVFESKQVRRVWHNEEWWFVLEDVVTVLAESNDPKQYIRRMRSRDPELSKGWVQIVLTLKVETPGGSQRMNCANTEGIFRIIQSIPSPKAEPFKQWLAKVGYERIQEIENPELAAIRAREYYQALGYSEEWIERRMQSIAIRTQLTEEWKNRGVQEGQEYAILTAEISKATFGLTPTEYKDIKGLKRENLRDHMTGLELIFTMLGEEETKNEAIDTDAQGFDENRKAARKGGSSAGKALDAFEQSSGRSVVTSTNFKGQIKEAKKQKKTLGKIEDEGKSEDVV